MKNTFFFFFIFSTSNFLFAQAPNWLWANSAGGSIYEYGTGIAADVDGNSYALGWFSSSSVTFGNTTLINAAAGSEDIFIVKYDTAGNVLWAKGAGGILGDVSGSISIDANANIYVTAFFTSPTITLDSITFTNPHPNWSDILLAKYDSAGNLRWAKSAAGMDEDIINNIAVDENGNSYITGEFYSSAITFDTITLINADSTGAHNDIFEVKYDSSGNLIWAKRFGGINYDGGTGVLIDNASNLYFGGYYYTPITVFGNDTLINNGYRDFYISKSDSSGNVLWVKGYGGTSNDNISSMAIDADANLYLSGGSINDTLILENDTLVNPAGAIFFAKFDSSGIIHWVKNKNVVNTSMTIASDANLYTTGNFVAATLILGVDTLTNAFAGSSDFYIAKSDTAGNVHWAKSIGGKAYEESDAIVVDANKNLFITGNFASDTVFFDSHMLIKSTGGGPDFFAAKLDSSFTNVFVEENNSSNPLIIYPNPSQDNFTIKYSSEIKNAPLEVYNIFGEKVYSTVLYGKQREIYSKLPQGIYFVKVTDGEKQFIKQLIVQ